ncbi:MAG: hypothetical protein DWQ07_04905 [Chloroflexi bacterium]|nr:MAG: hypothetical protein DWQ07_04905 [Chloroflexota bacterium]MBL1194771.1 hypothetical protein [Chloroflexota bacterium]NOH12063.1 ABC transporter substrate-binding protein [Chloroflexota bacterium]
MPDLDLAQLSQIPDLPAPPKRVVSLVPSTTESLFTLGFGDTVVGITDYCIHPAEALSDLPRLGGTKNPEVDEIIALKPDLVFTNQEENTSQAIQSLVDADVPVWLSFPQNVDQCINMLFDLVAIYHTDLAAMQLKALQNAIDWARGAAESQEPISYFCPIWQDEADGQTWWMTFNQHTFPHDLLAVFGGQNIFAERQRQYPLAADLGKQESDSGDEHEDTRYPRVTIEEVVEANPALILLPSEPFVFDDAHRTALMDILAETAAVKNNNVYLVDGSLITWHGTRIAMALQELPQYFS